MIFTTNKALTAWGRVLHDEDLAHAIADRILERGRMLTAETGPESPGQLRQKLVKGQHVDAVDPLAAHAEEHDDTPRNLASALDKRLKSFQVARVNATRRLDLDRPQVAAY